MQQFLQFIILTSIYSSTSFARPHAYHQELNDCSSSLWFYLRIVVIAVLSPRYEGKSEAATAVIQLLMIGGKAPETCSAVNKRQNYKLEKLLYLVDLFEYSYISRN
jgi:hypothetical protein